MTPYVLKDEHGQPVARFGNLVQNNLSKAFDQLSGICKGMLCDGIVTDDEARYFHDWVRKHTTRETPWPFAEILVRLNSIFSDGIVSEEEREEVAAIMRQIVGGDALGESMSEDTSTALPLDDPAPSIIEFPDREFCVTGRFAYGTRKKVMEAISARGGTFNDAPRRGTHYLVIGFFASKDWKYSSYGTKIERALDLRKSGGISIVAEEHWRRFIV
jgi:NAD-dependent DNA ligase